MKKQVGNSFVLALVLLFAGPIVIAGGSMGWESESWLPIHRGEFCRDAMIDALGSTTGRDRSIGVRLSRQ